MDKFKNIMKKLSTEGEKDDKTSDESSSKTKKPYVCPGHEKAAAASKHAKETPLQELEKLQDVGKDTDSKPNQGEKTKDESSLGQNLKDAKDSVKDTILNKSSKGKKPDDASPEQEDDSTGSKDIKEQPSHPIVRLPGEEKGKDSKPSQAKKSSDESPIDEILNDIKGPDKKMEKDKSSGKTKKPDDASPKQEKDSKGSKDMKGKPSDPGAKLKDEGKKKEDMKGKPSDPGAKLKDEGKKKDSKPTEQGKDDGSSLDQDLTNIEGLMTKIGITDSARKTTKPDADSPGQEKDATGLKDLKGKDPVAKLLDEGKKKDSKSTKKGKEDESDIDQKLKDAKGLVKGMEDKKSSPSKSPDQEKDAKGSKDKKETPSQALEKLQGEKDSKSPEKGKEDEPFKAFSPSETVEEAKDISNIEDTDTTMETECKYCSEEAMDTVPDMDKDL